MKKTTKHHFTHKDPEKLAENSNISGEIESLKPAVDKETLLIKSDLRRVIITICIFVILLVIFYFANEKYNFLAIFGRLFNL